jgi:hypothetical protein
MRNTNFFVNAACIPYGILINGQWYPVIKMEWVEGETLNQFILKNISNRSILESLANSFQSMISTMEPMDLAHGDLQHGNIMIKTGRPYLIDYDGMYLPSLSHLRSNELGHPNYQHPMRDEYYYNACMDRFSSIVIWLGLKALSLNPQLWRKYDTQENILFTRRDFLDPDRSQLLSELSANSQLFDYVERFKGVCFMDIDQVPTLDQFISGNFSFPKVRSYRLNTGGVTYEAEEILDSQTVDVFGSLYQDQPATPVPASSVASSSPAFLDPLDNIYGNQSPAQVPSYPTPAHYPATQQPSSTSQPVNVTGTPTKQERSALAKTGAVLGCGLIGGIVGLIFGTVGFFIGFLVGAYIGSHL